MTALSKNAYFHKLKEFMKQYYNYTIHRTVTMKSVDVKPETFSDFCIELMMFYSNIKKKNCDHAGISKYEIYFE